MRAAENLGRFTFSPCAHTELPKRVKRKRRTLDPEEYDTVLAALSAQHRLMVETAINTGLRWGELIALKPRHLDLTAGKLTVEETIVEVSRNNSPTDELGWQSHDAGFVASSARMYRSTRSVRSYWPVWTAIRSRVVRVADRNI